MTRPHPVEGRHPTDPSGLSVLLGAVSMYWGLSYHDHRGWGRLAMCIVFGVFTLVSIVRDDARNREMEPLPMGRLKAAEGKARTRKPETVLRELRGTVELAAAENWHVADNQVSVNQILLVALNLIRELRRSIRDTRGAK